MLIICLIVLLAIGVTVMIYGGKNIVKSVGFWMVGLATAFSFVGLTFVLFITLYFTATENGPYISYISIEGEEEETIEE